MAGGRVKIGAVDDLPPGRGKTLVIAGREVTIYNHEGRYVATASASPRGGGVGETQCEMPGHHFTVGPAMSPDRLRSDDRRYDVVVEAGAIYVVVEESG